MIKRKLAVLITLCAGMLVVGACASTNQAKVTKWKKKEIATARLPRFDIPIVVNDRVTAWIDYFQGPGRRYFEKYLARSGRYIPQMTATLKRHGLPQDLVYLAMIESGFSAKAYSRARAAGHWQFISSTGKRYGLDVNHWIDERRDPVDSTEAAARYLKDLYGIFGDWYLSMAAYNAGEGKILKAVRRNGTRDFWELIERDRRFLRNETKDYVPKFLAAAIISKSPERFGFGDVVYDTEVPFETAKVETQTDLQVVAKCAGVDVQSIEDLNPELGKGATPPGTIGYEIKLPTGTANKFAVNYAKVPESERIMSIRHTTRKGESIGHIAKRYGVSVREILAANDLSSGRKLKKGTVLIIPTGGESRRIIGSAVALETSHPSGRALKHRVQRGETIASIAQHYGVDVRSLKRWNRIKKDHVRIGQILRVYGIEDEGARLASRTFKKSAPQGLTHTVRRGDSWWKVAQKYGVSINELRVWNPEISGDSLKAGQRVKLFAAKEKKAVQSGDAVGVLSPAPVQGMDKPAPAMQLQTLPPEPIKPLSIKSETLPMPAMPATSAPAKKLSYQVKVGDTLWDIAQKYGVKVQDIKDWNNIDDTSHKRIKPGDYLTLNVE